MDEIECGGDGGDGGNGLAWGVYMDVWDPPATCDREIMLSTERWMTRPRNVLLSSAAGGSLPMDVGTLARMSTMVCYAN